MNAQWTALAAQADAEDEARRARLRAPEALAGAALYYAGLGVRVFPLQVGGKAPATKHGLHDASTDLDQVRAWWARTPQANIGLPTGHQFDVVDVDGLAGFMSLAQLRGDGLVPDTIGYALTPRGAHLYVPPSGEGNAAGVLPGIDVRGIGGYVVAAPSRSENGSWLWSTPLNLEATP